MIGLTQKQQTPQKIEIGKRLREIRKQLKLSMDELAVRIDSTSATISNIENGLSMPSGDTLLRLQERLRVSANWILRGETPVFSGTVEQFSDRDSKLLFFNEKWHFFCQIQLKYMSSDDAQRLEAIRQLLEISNQCSKEDLQFLIEMARRF